MEELVSILTPCYNHERYLEDYFSSIINQDYQSIELLIIDDASEDHSREIIESNLEILRKRFIRVEYIKNHCNLGITKSMNILFEKADGKYLKPLASDDMLHNQCITEMVKFFNAYPECDLCLINGYKVDDSYHYGDRIDYSKRFQNKISKQVFENLLFQNVLFAPGMSLQDRTIQKYGLYDENIEFEDWEYFLRIARTGHINVLNRYLVYYRMSKTSTCNIKCKNKKDKLNRFILMYNGSKKTIKKYVKYVDNETRIEVIKYFYVRQFERAVGLHLNSAAAKIYKKIVELKIKIPRKLERKYKINILLNIWRNI